MDTNDRIGCFLAVFFFVFCLGFFGVVFVADKSADKSQEKQRIARLELLNSWVQEGKQKLRATNSDSYPKNLVLSGRYVVWYFGAGQDEFLSMMTDDKYPEVSSNKAVEGGVMSYYGAYQDVLDGQFNIGGWLMSPVDYDKASTLVLVEGETHETNRYRTQERIIMSNGKTSIIPAPFDPLGESVSSYRFKVWLIEISSKQIIGHRVFTPGPLPNTALGSPAASIHQRLIEHLCTWLEGLYALSLNPKSLNPKYGGKILVMAVKHDEREITSGLLSLSRKVDMHAKDQYGNTALTLAAEGGHTDVVRLLIEKGAAVDAKAKSGHTALTLAVEGGHTDVVRLLIEKGAAVDAKAKSGHTALTLAVEGGHTDVVRLLIEKGAAVDAKAKSGHTALTLAVEGGHTDVVRLLIEKGAAVNAKAKFGYTALMLAVDRGHTDVVRLLIEKGAAVNAKAKFGYTALMLAVDRGHTDVVRLLIEKGADVNARTNGGMTALGIAEHEGIYLFEGLWKKPQEQVDEAHKDIVNLLKNADAK